MGKYCFDECVPGLMFVKEEALRHQACNKQAELAKHPKKKLLRSQPVRLEDVLLCRIPLQSALKTPNSDDHEKKKKNPPKCVTFSDEICIFGDHQTGSDVKEEYSPWEDGEENRGGGGVKVKLVLSKQEAAKLIAMNEGQPQTLKDLLMQLSKGKELATLVSQEQRPVLCFPENGNI
ncbi:hypothetical protein H6P81_014413 [Aristolochia fimbriata]|uniref:Uncharacterized protein n=1 Tax=Aristolochia fimbriata TaxID=158543 RepID=A0AAV7EJK3_ARIFI|nr:hypothetical protein H6P81_014413 [Aristolochia fimbriata]